MHAGIWGGGISGFLHTPPAGSIVLVWQLCAATPNALNPCTSPFTHPGTLKPAEPPPPPHGSPGAKDMGKVEPSWCPEHQKTSNTSDRCPSHHWANALAINSGSASSLGSRQL